MHALLAAPAPALTAPPPTPEEHVLASVWPEPEEPAYLRRVPPRQLHYQLGSCDLQLRLLPPRCSKHTYRLCGTLFGDYAEGVASWWPLAVGPIQTALDIDLGGGLHALEPSPASGRGSPALAPHAVATATIDDSGLFVLEVPPGCGVLRLCLDDELLELSPLGLSGF